MRYLDTFSLHMRINGYVEASGQKCDCRFLWWLRFPI